MKKCIKNYSKTYCLIGGFMNYLKSLLFVVVPFIVFSIIISLLYYFNILGDTIYSIFKIIVPSVSLFVGGVYLGKHSKENGWLEGLKLGGGFVLLFFLISILFLNSFSFKGIIYYIIILFSSMLGAMFGIRNVEKES